MTKHCSSAAGGTTGTQAGGTGCRQRLRGHAAQGCTQAGCRGQGRGPPSHLALQLIHARRSRRGHGGCWGRLPAGGAGQGQSVRVGGSGLLHRGAIGAARWEGGSTRRRRHSGEAALPASGRDPRGAQWLAQVRVRTPGSVQAAGSRHRLPCRASGVPTCPAAAHRRCLSSAHLLGLSQLRLARSAAERETGDGPGAPSYSKGLTAR